MFSVFRLKAAHRHNAGHYECSADFVPAEAAEDTRPRRDSGLDLSRGIFIDVLCKLSSVLQQPAFFSVMRGRRRKADRKQPQGGKYLCWKLLPQLSHRYLPFVRYYVPKYSCYLLFCYYIQTNIWISLFHCTRDLNKSVIIKGTNIAPFGSVSPPLCHTQLQKSLLRSWEEVGVVFRAVRWGKGKN